MQATKKHWHRIGLRKPADHHFCAGTILVWTCFLGIISAGWLDAAEKTASRISQGCSYWNDVISEKPWSIHVIKLERSATNLALHTVLGGGNRFGLGTLSAQIKSFPAECGRPIAGINGDYYYKAQPYVGQVKGLQIMRGVLIKDPCDWTCFWIDTNGIPHMTNVVSLFKVAWPNGDKTPFLLNNSRPPDAAVLYTDVVGSSTHTRGGREIILEQNGTNRWLPLQIGASYSARVREVRENSGDAPLAPDTVVLSLGSRAMTGVPKVEPGAVLQLSTATLPDLRGVTTAIGGGPALVRGGKVLERDEILVRHPRTAIGFNKDAVYLVEVDGRQLDLSVGMSYPELADYFVKLGCDEAMSLDGGASSTCWVYGQVMNSPSIGRERPMANGLVIVSKDKRTGNPK